MQKNFGTIFLQLFLCLLLSIIFLAYSYSDFRSSLQADYSTALNSVMAPKTGKTKTKRLLQGDHAETHDSLDETPKMCDDQIFATFSNDNIYHRIKSRRWKEVCQLSMTGANVSISEHHDKHLTSDPQNSTAIGSQSFNSTDTMDAGISQHLETNSLLQPAQVNEITGGSSYSLGQALYQRTKQGLAITYQDSIMTILLSLFFLSYGPAIQSSFYLLGLFLKKSDLSELLFWVCLI